jgi:hypothetical protein
MVIPILHGITADEAQLAIYDSQSVLQKSRWINQVPSTVPSQLGKSRNLPHTGILMKTYQVR